MDQGSLGVEDAAAAVTVHVDDGGVVVVPDGATTPQRRDGAAGEESGRDGAEPSQADSTAEAEGRLNEATSKADAIVAEAEQRLAEANRVRVEAEEEAARIRETMEAEARERAEAILAEAEERLAEANGVRAEAEEEAARIRQSMEAEASAKAQAIVADAGMRLAEANRLRQQAAEREELALEREKEAEASAQATLRQAEEQHRKMVDRANEDVREIHLQAESRMAEAARRLEDTSVTVDRMLRTARQEAEARAKEITDAARRRGAPAERTMPQAVPPVESAEPDELDLRALERDALSAPRSSPYSKGGWGAPETEESEPGVIEMPKWFEARDKKVESDEAAEAEPKVSGRRRRALPKIEDPELLSGLRSLRPEPKR